MLPGCGSPERVVDFSPQSLGERLYYDCDNPQVVAGGLQAPLLLKMINGAKLREKPIVDHSDSNVGHRVDSGRGRLCEFAVVSEVNSVQGTNPANGDWYVITSSDAAANSLGNAALFGHWSTVEPICFDASYNETRCTVNQAPDWTAFIKK